MGIARSTKIFLGVLWGVVVIGMIVTAVGEPSILGLVAPLALGLAATVLMLTAR